MKPLHRYETELLEDMLEDIQDDVAADLETGKVLIQTSERVNKRIRRNMDRAEHINRELDRRKKNES